MRRASFEEVGAPSDTDRDLDVGGLGRAIAARKSRIAGVTLAGFLAALAFVTIVAPRYTGETRLIVENQDNYFTRPDKTSIESATTEPDAEAVASQVQLVTSRDVARDAIRSLGLIGDPEFDPLARSPILTSIMTMLGLQSSAPGVAPEDRILDNYYNHLNVFSPLKSRVLQIEFTSTNPKLAARGANTIADLYIRLQTDAKRNAARVAADSLASLNADLRQRVAAADTKAEEYRAAHGLVLNSNNVSMSNQQLADTNAQIALARTAQADAQAKSKLIRDMIRQGRLGEVPDVANNDLMRKLSENRATLRAQIAFDSRTLLPGHPHIKELNAQAAAIDAEIRDAADKAARALENDAKIAGGRLDNLVAALGDQRKAMGGASGDETTARELDRDARLLKDQLEANVAKYQEALARVNAESTTGDARIVSRAVEPQLPSFPKKAPILIFATLAAFILSVGSVAAGEMMTGQAYAPEPDVAPRVAREAPRRPEPVASTPQRAAAEIEAREELAPPDALPERATSLAQLIGAKAQEGPLRVVVASPALSTKTSHAAVDLARSLALNARAVLVELDGEPDRAPDAPAGLGDLLASAATFDDVIHRDHGSRLHLVPVGRVSPPRAGEALDVALAALGETYDYLILLAAPFSVSGASLDLARTADFVVLVCKEGEEQGAIAQSLRAEAQGEILIVTGDEDGPRERRDAA